MISWELVGPFTILEEQVAKPRGKPAEQRGKGNRMIQRVDLFIQW